MPKAVILGLVSPTMACIDEYGRMLQAVEQEDFNV